MEDKSNETTPSYSTPTKRGRGRKSASAGQRRSMQDLPRNDGTMSDSATSLMAKAQDPQQQAQQQRQGNPKGGAPRSQRKQRPASSAGPFIPSTTPVREKAFAGSTFQHISPAPSSLPLPRFPRDPVPLDQPPAVTSPPEQNPTSTRPSIPQPNPTSSPVTLNILFQADRAEKEQKSHLRHDFVPKGPPYASPVPPSKICQSAPPKVGRPPGPFPKDGSPMRQPQEPHDAEETYHYGNRNLESLFQTAKQQSSKKRGQETTEDLKGMEDQLRELLRLDKR